MSTDKKYNLNNNREKITTIDSRIISLLSSRIRIAKKLCVLKKKKGLKICDREREKEVIEHAKRITKDTGLDEKFVEMLFKDIIKYTRGKQK